MTTTITAIKLSDLNPNDIERHPGEPILLVCPDCKCWRRVDRRKLVPHDKADGQVCKSSSRRVEIDETVEELADRLRQGVLAVASIGRRTHTKPRIGKGPAIAQVSRNRQRHTELVQHTRTCRSCRAERPCEAARTIWNRIALADHGSECGTCQTGRMCGEGRRLNDTVALDRHNEQCTVCEPGGPCERGWRLQHRVALGEHLDQCRICRGGHRCPDGQRHQDAVDLDHAADARRAHMNTCPRCRQGLPCSTDTGSRKQFNRLSQRELSEHTSRQAAATAPRRYNPAS
ncbi:hypothetical protein ACEZDB_35955 [Streptacidiphilus sp. N1-3]|uniref:Uncharacterized protein n=1 Tax=Streptacidiphilus alkalitolerans TaxID=3342712 RepID=A0ABV6XDJ3_9ACTN